MRRHYLRVAKNSFVAVVLSLVFVCGCSPHRPFKSAILSVKASGWMEHYGIETEEDLTMSASIPKLTNAMKDPNELVRSNAVKHLIPFGSEASSAIPQLKILAVCDKSNRVRLKSLLALTKIAGSEDENALFAYDITLSDKSRRSRKLRQGVVNMLGMEELGPKVISLLKEHYETEPYAYPKKTMLEMVLRYEILEKTKKEAVVHP